LALGKFSEFAERWIIVYTCTMYSWIIITLSIIKILLFFLILLLLLLLLVIIIIIIIVIIIILLLLLLLNIDFLMFNNNLQ
jgi:hypothetical protein